MTPKPSTFGEALRNWRGVRRMSQLQLAIEAGISSRHLSFLETGRSSPSPDMVLLLGRSLELPFRVQNDLLLAAGYAHHYKTTSLEAFEMRPVLDAVQLMLAQQEPFPAFVVDRSWNIIFGNRTSEVLLGKLMPAGVEVPKPANALRLILDPTMLRPLVTNWETVAHVLGHRAQREAVRLSEEDPARAELESLLELPGVRAAMRISVVPMEEQVVLPLEFAQSGMQLRFITFVATLGAPLDTTLEDLRIESLFPADEDTKIMLEELHQEAREEAQ